MIANFFAFAYSAFLAFVAAGSLLLIGYLFLLEICELRFKCRTASSRARLGRPGISVWVRGLGLRSEPAATCVIGASQTGTVAFGSTSNLGSIIITRTRSGFQTFVNRNVQPTATGNSGAENLFASAGRG